ncbi:REP element-mobilizing transposase RayT [Geosporobacter subterraneus DSM 17957]|uniref:REP element-mobilizing transposase RayT n=1 Tax=Geosporobacter subterraneus DSM 17957 TaxID=1121919 RepID=A0A1M6I214_9FIRM|nr:transposase [Geosporobacter subterraneus]SHJ28430.1 REP element-mobilizing transposase RayT [Geosporobacter subterraneus DSM 17957]
MPRQAREKGEFSTYHIIQRGNDRKEIFLSDHDKTRFVETLIKMKNKYNFIIYAYCLMDNHVHLLINDNGNDISKLMKSINVSYVLYFNRKYKRCGHFFQNRFISELITDDKHLIEVSKYIHNNPVKAGIVQRPKAYKWSSYGDYMGNVKSEFIDVSKVLDIFSNTRSKAIKEYQSYVNKIGNTVEIMDIKDPYENVKENTMFIDSIAHAKEILAYMLADRNLSMEECIVNKDIRNEMIRYLRKNSNLTLKEIGQVFGGISESRVSRILSR